MEIQLRPLTGSPLVEGLEEGRAEALELFPGSPDDPDAYRAKAEEVDGRFGPGERERVAEGLRGGGRDGPERLRRFVEEEGLVVTTGQQPGLFGGPLYTLFKGFTAAALARRLEELLDRPVIPVFWIGSEDHDYEEARAAHVLDPENELHDVSLPPREGGEAPALHSLALGEELAEAVARLRGHLPETDFSSEWVELLERTHEPGTTIPAAFQAVLEALLGREGVFLVQSHEPWIKEASLDLLLRELAEAEASEAELRKRGGEVEAAGFPLQVPLLEGATNLFLEGPAGRERIFREEGEGLRLRRSGSRLKPEEAEARARSSPSVLSPNVVLRPVVEAAVLPTVAYVAGPGEVAYLPQAAPLFARHGVGAPVVHPRASMTIFEGKVAKVLEKFDLSLDDLARPHHEVLDRLIRDEMPEGLREALGSLRGEVARGARDLAREIGEVDPTLKGPVEHFRNQAFGLLDEVERKAVQGLKRQAEVTEAQIRKAQVHLFPLGRPQERVLNPFYYLVRYGAGFLDEVASRAGSALRVPGGTATPG